MSTPETPCKIVNARIFKGRMPDSAGRRTPLSKVPLYHARCDCGFAADCFTQAHAEHLLSVHAQHEQAKAVSDPYRMSDD